MLDDLRSALTTLEVLVREFEPRLLDGPGAVRAVELFARVKHLGAAGAALAAKRVDDTRAYQVSGARSVGHWLAGATGDTVAAAFKSIETVNALDELPATADAFRAGRLSEAQAHEITGAARKDPSAEAELLGAVRRCTSMKGLKDSCRRVRARPPRPTTPPGRSASTTRARCANGSTATARRAARGACRPTRARRSRPRSTPRPTSSSARRVLRARTRRERRTPPTRSTRSSTRGPRKATSAHLVCDETALQRGHARKGERCEITGVGPIPVTIARAMLADAKVRAVPRDGALLPEYSSDDRYYPQWLRDWLDQQYPVCGQPGCDADFHLQYDHVVPMEEGGRTERNNLWRLCWHHHDAQDQPGMEGRRRAAHVAAGPTRRT